MNRVSIDNALTGFFAKSVATLIKGLFIDRMPRLRYTQVYTLVKQLAHLTHKKKNNTWLITVVLCHIFRKNSGNCVSEKIRLFTGTNSSLETESFFFFKDFNMHYIILFFFHHIVPMGKSDIYHALRTSQKKKTTLGGDEKKKKKYRNPLTVFPMIPLFALF